MPPTPFWCTHIYTHAHTHTHIFIYSSPPLVTHPLPLLLSLMYLFCFLLFSLSFYSRICVSNMCDIKRLSPSSSFPHFPSRCLCSQLSLLIMTQVLYFSPLCGGRGEVGETGFTAVCNLIYMRASLGIYVCYVAYNYSVFSFRLGSTHPRPQPEWCEMHSHTLTYTQSHSVTLCKWVGLKIKQRSSSSSSPVEQTRELSSQLVTQFQMEMGNGNRNGNSNEKQKKRERENCHLVNKNWTLMLNLCLNAKFVLHFEKVQYKMI